MKSIYCRTAEWFVNYDSEMNETALVIGGGDGVGVFFLILKNNHVEDFHKIMREANNIERGLADALGECIRYAAQHDDLIPERCTIGGVFNSRLAFKEFNIKK